MGSEMLTRYSMHDRCVSDDLPTVIIMPLPDDILDKEVWWAVSTRRYRGGQPEGICLNTDKEVFLQYKTAPIHLCVVHLFTTDPTVA
jgi:hypothetical protein